MYKIYGDYGYIAEMLLEEFENFSDAIRWVENYVDSGDFGGYTTIEIATFQGDEYVIERRWDADDYEDETVFYEGDDDNAMEWEY